MFDCVFGSISLLREILEIFEILGLEVSAGDSSDDVMLCVGIVVADVLLLVLLTSVERRRLSKWQRRVFDVAAGISRRKCFSLFCVLLLDDQQLTPVDDFSAPADMGIAHVGISRWFSLVPAGFVGGNALLLVAASLVCGFAVPAGCVLLRAPLWVELSIVPWRFMHSTCILFLAVISVVLLLSVLGFDPMSLRGLVCFFVVLFSGNPGSTAGRGFNPAGGAPGRG
ncbi:hypothetical protein F511_42239 [Dorcoceras hygrometricum]|uniref:Uncharacterized protein n=1 Tax=Dorcoceras hygrometricum TaxID=472368 RepID=A0A2Z7A6U8_9LAMI|nr:hypothetical protein F511_42239 [Dorcoceras hygrometricum]